MGNMPVIKDLIVDMEAVHWKKIRRVTPWLIPKQPVPEREYIVPRENMVDVTQSMACIQCGACVLGLPVDGGRPGVHRPGGAGQGLPLRRRPARRPAPRAAGGPRRGPARHLRLHALLPVHRRLPEGRRADEPDHAPAPPAPATTSTSRIATTASATRRRSSRWSSSTGCSTRPSCCRAPTAATRRWRSSSRRPRAELASSLPVDRQGAAAPQGDAGGGVQAAQAAGGRPQGGQGASTTRSRAATSAASSTSTSPAATRI